MGRIPVQAESKVQRLSGMKIGKSHGMGLVRSGHRIMTMEVPKMRPKCTLQPFPERTNFRNPKTS